LAPKAITAILMSVMSLKAGIAALAVAAMAAGAATAQTGGVALVCTNLSSGATWRIRVDYQKGTVDANPARITDAEISWHDVADGGNYTLDRKSGKLTVVVASSTGGYFLHHRCSPEK
jgi:hypothetical protein